MKHVSLSCNTSFYLLCALVLFLATISIASAQTDAQLRPGSVNVANVHSDERTEFTSEEVSVPVQIGDTENVQTDAVKKDRDGVEIQKVRTQRDINATDKPRSFLDKARTVLEEKRRGSDTIERREKRSITREDQRQERIASFLNKVKRKMDAATTRLLKIAERIESRIVKFEEREIDMTEARRLLEVAKGNISSAGESITTAVENARTALASELSRNSFGSVVSELRNAKEHLRSAHKSLIEVVRIMKASLSDNSADTKDDTQDTDDAETDETN